MQKKVKAKIKGISPLLMHAFPMTELKGYEKLSPSEQAEHCTYRIPETKQLCVPAIALQRALVSGASYSKGKGRSTLVKQVAACVFITPLHLVLPVQSYEIDSRPVVVPATRGRIVRHRPVFKDWELEFETEFDSTLLTENQLRTVLDDTGSRVGLLDFRPEKKGPFGRFMVTSWEII